MLSNYSRVGLVIIQIQIFFNIFYFGFKSNSVLTNMMDIYTRIILNEFYWNFFYYNWTTFWYIPITLSIILFLLSKKFNYYLNLYYYNLTTIILTILLLDIIDYLNLNINYYSYLNNYDNYNILLVNSINKYHPGMLYISVLYLFSFVYYNINFKFIYVLRYFPNIHTYLIVYYIPFITILLSTTLFFGSWWAYQEGSWGGWWNWDPSEVFGLLFFVLFMYLSHQSKLTLNISKYFSTSILYLYMFVIVYILLQINFDSISHSFGIKSTYFIQPLLFYTIVLYLFTTLLITYTIYIYKNILNFLIYKPINTLLWLNLHYTNKYITYYILILLLATQLITSLIPLLISFYSKSNLLTYYNIFSIIKYINYFYIYTFYIILWFFNKPTYIIIIYTLLIPTIYPLLFIMYKFLLNTRIINLHLLILCFLLISVISETYLINLQAFNTYTVDNTLSSYNYYYMYSTLSINTFIIQVHENYLNTLYLNNISNILIKSTTDGVKSFIFHFTNNVQSQILILGNLLKNYTISSWDLHTNILFSLWTFISLWFYTLTLSSIRLTL